jgi:hypothetical protein
MLKNRLNIFFPLIPCIVAIMICLLVNSQTVAGNGGPIGRYLRAPAVTWQNGRISGDVRDVPIQGLVEDLLRSGGYEWFVEGRLQGQVSVTFDGLTLVESVRKVMKQSDLDFAMIQANSESPDGGQGESIEQLTIYQTAGFVRFSRTENKATAASTDGLGSIDSDTHTAAMQSSPLVKASPALPAKETSQTAKPMSEIETEVTLEERAKLDKDIKEMFGEMLLEKQITEEEYREIMEEMEKTGN